MTRMLPIGHSLSRLLSIQEVATAAGVAELTILREIKRGNLAVIRIGRRTLIHPDDWEAYLGRRPEAERGQGPHAVEADREGDWVRTGEVARSLGVSRWTVRRLILSGVLPARRFAERGTFLVDRVDLEMFLERSRVTAGEEPGE